MHPPNRESQPPLDRRPGSRRCRGPAPPRFRGLNGAPCSTCSSRGLIGAEVSPCCLPPFLVPRLVVFMRSTAAQEDRVDPAGRQLRLRTQHGQVT